MDIDPTLHKTQCSVYSVANKQQPSIVHFPNRTEKIQLGHDVMMAEKEKFLGKSFIVWLWIGLFLAFFYVWVLVVNIFSHYFRSV